MTVIREIDRLQYVSDLEECRTALSDLYVFTRDARILEAVGEDGQAAGMLLWHGDAGRAVIDFVSARCPREGIATALIGCLADELAGKGVRRMSAVIAESNPSFEAFAGLMRRCGFSVSDISDVYRSDQDRIQNWINGYFRQSGRKLLDYLEKKGFLAYSFREAPPEVIAQVLDPDNEDLDQGLSIAGVVGGERGAFCEEDSFVTVKDGQAVACCLTCMYQEGHYGVEALSVLGKYRRAWLFSPSR